jgi:hypothetical protein
MLRARHNQQTFARAFLTAKYTMVSCCLMVMIQMFGGAVYPPLNKGQKFGDWARLDHLKAAVGNLSYDSKKSAVVTEWLKLAAAVQEESISFPGTLPANCFAPFTDTVLRV